MKVHQRLGLFCGMVAVIGCDGMMGEGAVDAESAKAHSSVLVNQGELGEESSECLHGGVSLDYGIDSNGDGELSSEEVSKVLVICHGRPGLDVDAAVLADLNDKIGTLEAELVSIKSEKITVQERASIVANTMKVGTTVEERTSIVDNSKKVGISEKNLRDLSMVKYNTLGIEDEKGDVYFKYRDPMDKDAVLVERADSGAVVLVKDTVDEAGVKERKAFPVKEWLPGAADKFPTYTRDETADEGWKAVVDTLGSTRMDSVNTLVFNTLRTSTPDGKEFVKYVDPRTGKPTLEQKGGRTYEAAEVEEDGVVRYKERGKQETKFTVAELTDGHELVPTGAEKGDAAYKDVRKQAPDIEKNLRDIALVKYNTLGVDDEKGDVYFKYRDPMDKEALLVERADNGAVVMVKDTVDESGVKERKAFRVKEWLPRDADKFPAYTRDETADEGWKEVVDALGSTRMDSVNTLVFNTLSTSTPDGKEVLKYRDPKTGKRTLEVKGGKTYEESEEAADGSVRYKERGKQDKELTVAEITDGHELAPTGAEKGVAAYKDVRTYAPDIEANKLKIGITEDEKVLIADNSEKVKEARVTMDDHKAWRDFVAPEIDANTVKVGITAVEKERIVANTDKVGITVDEKSRIVDNTKKVGVSDKNLRDIALVKYNTLGVDDENGDVFFKYRDPKDKEALLVERADNGKVAMVKDTVDEAGVRERKAFPVSEWLPRGGDDFPAYTRDETADEGWKDVVNALGSTRMDSVNTLVFNTLSTSTPDGKEVLKYRDPKTGKRTLEVKGGKTYEESEAAADGSVRYKERGKQDKELTVAEITDGHELAPTGAEKGIAAYKDVRTYAPDIEANKLKIGITADEKVLIADNSEKVKEARVTMDDHKAWRDFVAPEIDANTVKVGITAVEKERIVANTDKVGITVEEKERIVVNTTKIGITVVEKDRIVANTEKVGITVEEKGHIVANTSKVGITVQEKDRIVMNTEKVGITPDEKSRIVDNTKKVGVSDKNLRDIALVKYNTLGVDDENGDVFFKYRDPMDKEALLVERADNGEVVMVKDTVDDQGVRERKAFPVTEWLPQDADKFPDGEWYSRGEGADDGWKDVVDALGSTRMDSVNTLVFNTLRTSTPDGREFLKYVDPKTGKPTLEEKGGRIYEEVEDEADGSVRYKERGRLATEFTVQDITDGFELTPTGAEKGATAYKDVRSVKVGDETLVSFDGTDGVEYFYESESRKASVPVFREHDDGLMRSVDPDALENKGEALGTVSARGLIGSKGLVGSKGLMNTEGGKRASFDEMMESIETLEMKATSLETKANDLEAKSNDLETKANDLERKANDLETKATSLETKANDLETKSRDLETKVDDNFEKLDEDLVDFSYSKEVKVKEGTPEAPDNELGDD